MTWACTSSEPEYVSPVGSDSILHDGALFPLHPGEDVDKAHHNREQKAGFGNVDCIFHDKRRQPEFSTNSPMGGIAE